MVFLIIVIVLAALGLLVFFMGGKIPGIIMLAAAIILLAFNFGAIKAVFSHDSGKAMTTDQFIEKNGFKLDDTTAISEDEFNEKAKEKNAELAKEKSDIKGKSKLDKVQMGLGSENGSDTDGDGLTDKEEIEKYHSDPRKESTSGDLYTDGYKVKHNMKLDKKYDRNWKNVKVKNNKSGTIRPVITDLSQTFCSISDATGIDTLKNAVVFAEYRVDDCKTDLMIDTSSVEKKYSIEQSDISVYITRDDDPADAVKMKTDIKDGCLVVDPLEKGADYFSGNIFLTEKKTVNIGKVTYLAQGGYNGAEPVEPDTSLLSSDAAKAVAEEYEPTYTLAFGFPIAAAFAHNMSFWYPDMGDKDKTKSVRKAGISGATKEMEENPFSSKKIEKKSKKEIDKKYKFFKKFFPDCESTGDFPDGDQWQNIFFWYCRYDENGKSDAMKAKEQKIKATQEEMERLQKEAKAKAEKEAREAEKKLRAQTKTGFAPSLDELPFENFGDQVSAGGNCMGISLYTAQLYNNKKFAAKGGKKIKDKSRDAITYECSICGKKFANKDYEKVRETEIKAGKPENELSPTGYTACWNHIRDKHNYWNLLDSYNNTPIEYCSENETYSDVKKLKPLSEFPDGQEVYVQAYGCQESDTSAHLFYVNENQTDKEAKKACSNFKKNCNYYADVRKYGNNPIKKIYKEYSLQYNLGNDDENKTLMDLKLVGYKDTGFVKNNSVEKKRSGVLDDDSLTDGEKQFVKMIEYLFIKGNNAYFKYNDSTVSRPSYQAQLDNYKDASGNQLTPTEAQKTHLRHPYSYKTITNIKKEIDKGNVVCLAMNSYGSDEGHVVVLYDYNVVNDVSGLEYVTFDVYDCNFPYEQQGQANTYKLVVTQTPDNSFSYSYGNADKKYLFAPYYGSYYGFHFSAFTSDMKSLVVMKKYKDVSEAGTLVTE